MIRAGKDQGRPLGRDEEEASELGIGVGTGDSWLGKQH